MIPQDNESLDEFYEEFVDLNPSYLFLCSLVHRVTNGKNELAFDGRTDYIAIDRIYDIMLDDYNRQFWTHIGLELRDIDFNNIDPQLSLMLIRYNGRIDEY